jgi:hypothetical protein
VVAESCRERRRRARRVELDRRGARFEVGAGLRSYVIRSRRD